MESSSPKRKSPLSEAGNLKSAFYASTNSSRISMHSNPEERERIRRMSSVSDAVVDRQISTRASLTLSAVAKDIEFKVQFEPIKVKHSEFESQCYNVIEAFFPHWNVFNKDIHASSSSNANATVTLNQNISFDQMKDGITNKLMKCTNTLTGEIVLVRTYGKKSEILIDRTLELMNMYSLNKLGFAPPLYGRFLNGFLYGFFEGSRFKVEDMSDPVKSKLVAQKLGLWHRSSVPGDKTPGLFATLTKWIQGVPDVYENRPLVQESFVKNINMVSIEAELALLKGVIEMLGSPIAFCHNDLLSGNIIYQEAKNDGPGVGAVQFIDYEYGGYNYRGFDIGNHFCEFAGFDCDFSLFPEKAFQITWLRSYLEAFKDSADPVSDQELDDLYVEVNIFALAAHMYWGIWALIQAQFSDIDFDYMGYAKLRFDQYFKQKPGIFSLLEGQ